MRDSSFSSCDFSHSSPGLWNWDFHENCGNVIEKICKKIMKFSGNSFLISLIFLFWWRVVQGNPDAKRLYDDLLSNYNRLIRPVANNTDTVLVKLGLRLSQLIDLVSMSIHFTCFKDCLLGSSVLCLFMFCWRRNGWMDAVGCSSMICPWK